MTGTTTSYLLKVPKPPGRNRFYLLTVSRDPSGKRSHEAFKSPLLDLINVSYQRGVFTLEQATKQAVDLRARLNREAKGLPGGIVFNQENLSILGPLENPPAGTYWKDVYGRRKRILDRRSSYYDLRRAIEAVGNLSLLTATEDELQAKIDGGGFEDNKQRRIVSRLMPILRFLGRTDIKLEKAREEQKEVRYLSMGEFEKVVTRLPTKPLQALCRLAIHSGLRQGELFALQPGNISKERSIVQVNLQLDKEGVLRPTKGRNKRKAYLVDGAGQAVDDWLAVPEEERMKLRVAPLAEYVTRACAEAFPKNPPKWCVFHDLRHSYAIHLLERGVPLSFVARSLGNSELVCEKHYTGKVLTDGYMEGIKAMLGGSKL